MEPPKESMRRRRWTQLDYVPGSIDDACMAASCDDDDTFTYFRSAG